jgi:purine-binding chemotaxis protein CheW
MQTVKDTLKRRAIEAAKIVEVQEIEDGVDIISFRIGKEVYAIEDRFVNEVYPYLHPTEVPCTPEFILGIVNIRGGFISIVDLELILGLQKIDTKDDGFILLLSDEKMEFGIMVEEILDEIMISKKSIQPVPQGLNIITRELIDGVTEDGVIVLDGKIFLEDSKIVVHEEVYS